ncbi:MED8-like protein, partial [Mya arenaria]
KEEEQQRIALDNLIQRVTELKNSVGALIFKLEHEYETLKWPSVLDNYSLLSSQLQSLGKLLKGDKMPQLKNKILLPIFISPEPDESLAKLTENRVMMFNHEVAPSFLRTKPPPDVEEKTGLLTGKAQQLPQDQTQ